MTSPASRRRPATASTPLLVRAQNRCSSQPSKTPIIATISWSCGGWITPGRVPSTITLKLSAWWSNASPPSRNPRGLVGMSSTVNAGMPAAKAAGSANNSCIAAWIVARASSPCTACLQVSTKVVRTAGVFTGVPQVGRNQTAVSDGSSSVSPGIEVSRISPTGIGTDSAPMLATQRTPLARE